MFLLGIVLIVLPLVLCVLSFLGALFPEHSLSSNPDGSIESSESDLSRTQVWQLRLVGTAALLVGAYMTLQPAGLL
jgi:hypothetical protein